MPYYYSCPYPLASGSVIQRGNWGRICKFEPISQNTHLLKELILENIRLTEYPERPSRFNCTFVCPNIDSLRAFVTSNNRLHELLYEVELVTEDAKTFETAWSFLPASDISLMVAQEAARNYWSPKNARDDQKELLVESDIRIIRQLPLRDT